MGPTDPDCPLHEMAVVVLSYGPRATLAAAVRSLQSQETPAEIVVVHSGAGDPTADLAEAGVSVRAVRSETRLLPGGARNLGIAETRAPYVAFLADDCMAGEGWVRERLAAHRAGSMAVASALLCHRPADPIALAAHLSLFVRRMPQASPDVALRYGASYARALFDRYGRFRDDLVSGEDTEFNQRLAAHEKPVWAPGIQTVHAGTETLHGLLTSQFGRGRRMARAWHALGMHTAGEVARNAIERTTLIVRESRHVVPARYRLANALAIPLIVLGSVSYALGALTAGRGK